VIIKESESESEFLYYTTHLFILSPPKKYKIKVNTSFLNLYSEKNEGIKNRINIMTNI